MTESGIIQFRMELQDKISHRQLYRGSAYFFIINLMKEFVTDDSSIPLPTRLADIGTHKVRTDFLKTHNKESNI